MAIAEAVLTAPVDHPVFRPVGAIVLGGDYRGLGIARNLGRHGIPVCIIHDVHTVAAHSRFAERVTKWPPASDDETLRKLLALRSESAPGSWAIYPTTDQMTGLLARNHELLGKHFVVTTCRPDVIDIAQDKRLSHELARTNQLNYPRTWLPRNIQDVEKLAPQFPVIIKPAVKHQDNPLVHDKAWKVNDKSDLLRQYQAATRLLAADEIMIQDMIPGNGQCQLSYAGVMDKGQPVAEVVAKRLRQYPMDFGLHSTYVESVEDREVEQAGRKLVAALNYTGLIEIEFKRDPRDGSLNLLDINTRVWGWHTLGERCKVDFVHVSWRLIQGETIAPTRVPAGEAWIRLLTDTVTAMQEIRRKRLTVRDYLQSLLRSHDAAIFAMDDPFPVVLDAPMMAYLRFRRALHQPS